MTLALLLHLLAVIVWVGGMFFAQFALRPAAAATLEPPLRLALLAVVFGHFLTWIAAAIVVLVGSGAYMIVAMGGMRAVGAHVHVMIGLGGVMILIFGHVRYASYRRLKAAVAAQDWPAAGAAMGRIRPLILANLVLGVVVVAVAVLGRAA